MGWQRLLLGIAILSMTVTVFIPLPLWAATTLISISLIAALIVLTHLALRRRQR